MKTTRRDLLKMTVTAGGALGLGLAAPSVLRGQEPAVPPPPPPVPVAPLEGVAKAAKPLSILILGGTGFTGPHQVRYALARGHELTLFNRGRRPKEWPAEVEELTGDRNTGDLAALADRTWDVCIDNPTTLPFWVRDAGRCSGQGRPVRLHLHAVGLRQQRRAGDGRGHADRRLRGRRRDGRDPRHAAREPVRPLRAVEGGVGTRGREVVPGDRHRHPAGPDRRPGRRDRPLHLLAGPPRRGAARWWRRATAATRCR
jgi:hypothetical protein